MGRSTLALIKPDATCQPWLEQYDNPVAPPLAAGEDDAVAPSEPQFQRVPVVRALDASIAIIDRIRKAGITVKQQKCLVLSKAQAEEFYAAHAGKPFFEGLTSYMCSGPITALELETLQEGEDAVPAWRALMGPTNSAAARAAAEAAHPLDEESWSIRALFGTDGRRNAVHGSDSQYAAERELAFFFPSQQPVWEYSIAVVQRHVVESGAIADVLNELGAGGFHLTARLPLPTGLPANTAGALLPAGAPPELRAELEQACIGGEALLVERREAVLALRLASGLAPPSIAASDAPRSWHARFGVDDTARLGVVAAPSADAVRGVLGRALFADVLATPEVTLALLLPSCSPQAQEATKKEIKAAGFTLLAERTTQLSRDDAEVLLRHRSGSPLHPALLAALSSSSPVTALAISKPAAVAVWSSMLGPETSAATAAREWPSSLRARLPHNGQGDDGVSGVYGSLSPADAATELRLFFPNLPIAQPLAGAAASAYMHGTTVAHVWDPTRKAQVPMSLEAVVVNGLTALARAKPSSEPAEAIRWLGQWFLDHNPASGHVQHAGAGAAAGGPSIAAPTTAAPVPAAATGGSAVVVGAGAQGAPATSPANKPPCVIFVVAPPAVGKGTQCARLAKRFNFRHLSTGDLLRAEVAAGSPLGREAESIMKAGLLVPDSLVLQLLQHAMRAPPPNGAAPPVAYLVDGYPRSLSQALEFERAIGAAPALVLSFKAREVTLEARMASRAVAEGRADDNASAFKSRLATFASQSEPVLEFYRGLGLLAEVDGEGSPDAVFGATLPLLQPQLVWVSGPPGAGASTLCTRLTSTAGGQPLPGLSAISLPDALWRLVDALGGELHSEDAYAVASALRRGDAPRAGLITRALRAATDAAGPLGRYLVDGLPATPEVYAATEAEFGPPLRILSLDAAPKGGDVALLERATRSTSASRSGVQEVGADPRARAPRCRAVAARALANHRKGAPGALAPYSSACRVTPLDARLPAAMLEATSRRVLAPTILFVLGGPGSGKGTQCARLVSEGGYAHLSVGDLLRAEVRRASPAGAGINECIALGRIVPTDVTLGLLRQAIGGSRAARFLVDGFPRALDQAHAFEAAIGTPAAVLFFDCPKDVMKARLLERGKTSGRVDDNEASIAARLDTFVAQSMPVVLAYAARGKLLSFDATSHPDAVAAAVKAALAPRVVCVLGRGGSGKRGAAATIAAEFGGALVSASGVLSGAWAAVDAAGAAGAVSAASPQPPEQVAPQQAQQAAEESKAAPGVTWTGALTADATAIPLVHEAIARALAAAPCSSLVVLDGYPRTLAQAQALEGKLGAVPYLVLHCDVPAAVAQRAQIARRTTPNAHASEVAALTAAAEASAVTFQQNDLQVIQQYAKARGPLVRTVAVPTNPRVELSKAQYEAVVRPLLQPSLAILLGAPGSGRHTLAQQVGRELGYTTIRVGDVIASETAAGEASPFAAAICEAARQRLPVPSSVALDMVAGAIKTSGAHRVMLDGYPRLTLSGFPGIHDQVFALEERVGPVKGAVSLDVSWEERARRVGAGTVGEVKALRSRLEAAAREKAPVLSLFRKLGKAVEVETSALRPEAVFEVVKPFLQ